MGIRDFFQENAAGIPGFQWVKDRNAQKDAERERKEVAAANERLAAALGLAGQQYAQQRPFRSAASQEALRNQLGLFSPANEMMREMSGGRYALDLNAPVERYPSPYNMQLAAQQAANPPPTSQIDRQALLGNPQAAQGWGTLVGTASGPADPTRAAIEARIRGTQGMPPSRTGGR